MTKTLERNTGLLKSYADKLRPLLPEARKANGRQPADHPARAASAQVDELLVSYVEEGGNMTHLAEELEGVISLAGLRRRHRAAAAAKKLAAQGISLELSSTRGSQDPELVSRAAAAITQAQASKEPGAYGAAVREHVVFAGVSMGAVAKELDRDYFALWTAARSSV